MKQYKQISESSWLLRPGLTISIIKNKEDLENVMKLIAKEITHKNKFYN